MEATIDIDRMIEICFAAQFFVYGYMALFLYPYNDYDTAPRMRHTGSKPYLRGRRVLAVVYIFLGIVAGFGLCPASPSNGSGADGWASPESRLASLCSSRHMPGCYWGCATTPSPDEKTICSVCCLCPCCVSSMQRSRRGAKRLPYSSPFILWHSLAGIRRCSTKNTTI